MNITSDIAAGEEFMDSLMLEDGIDEIISRREEIYCAEGDVKYLVRATQDTDEEPAPSVVMKTGFSSPEDALDYIDTLEDRDDSIYTVEYYHVDEDQTGIHD